MGGILQGGFTGAVAQLPGQIQSPVQPIPGNFPGAPVATAGPIPGQAPSGAFGGFSGNIDLGGLIPGSGLGGAPNTFNLPPTSGGPIRQFETGGIRTPPPTGQQTPSPFFAQQLPQTGLIGAESALQGGLTGALSALQGGFGQSREDLLNAQRLGLSRLGGGGGGAPSINIGGGVNLGGALNQGLSQLSGARSTGTEAINRLFGQGAEALGGFAGAGGVEAAQQQAALSGALGPEAQQQAFNAFVASPEQAFQTEQAERALVRQAGALGGLGGGNVRVELQRRAIGEAQQDIENRFNRLAGVSGQAQQAATSQAGLLGQQGQAIAGLEQGIATAGAGLTGQIAGQQAGLAGSLASTQAGLQSALAGQQTSRQLAGAQLAGQIGGQLAGIGSQQGLAGADLFSGTGTQLATGRTRAGEQIAQQGAATSTQLANLINQQGAGLADIVGAGGGNLAAILQQAGLSQAGGQQDLATLLANISVGSGTGQQLSGAQFIQQGGQGELLGSLLQAGGAFAASDRRLKTNIIPIGTTSGGNNLYTWDWTEEAKLIVGNQPGYGGIADEIEKINPEAVIIGSDGFQRVDYSKVA